MSQSALIAASMLLSQFKQQMANAASVGNRVIRFDERDVAAVQRVLDDITVALFSETRDAKEQACYEAMSK